MSPRTTVALLLVVSSCAAPSASSREGDPPWAGEGGDGQGRVPPNRQPTQDELASAFLDGSAPPPPAQPAVATTGAPSAVEPDGGAVPEVDPKDPLEEGRRAFDEEERRFAQLLAAKDPAFAASAESLERASAPLGAEHVQRALRARIRAAEAQGDAPARAELAARLLGSCGPERVDVCRRAALKEIDRAVRAGAGGKWKTRAAEARTADACLKAAEAAPGKKEPAPECLRAAKAAYARVGDALMVARANLADARARLFATDVTFAAANAALSDMEAAVDGCRDPARCREVARRTYSWLSAALLRRKEAARAATAALRAVGLHADALPPALRPYAWSEEATRACAAYDAEAGAGACRKLERRLTGRHAFVDFSRREEPGEGLSPESVKQVNAHYGVTLEQCLEAQAARLFPPAQERYTLRWTVRNDGRVVRMALGRRDLEEGPLGACLRERLSVWRYPRYQGELQHVEQSFVVVARSR